MVISAQNPYICLLYELFTEIFHKNNDEKPNFPSHNGCLQC